RTISNATSICVSCDELLSFPGFPAVASDDIDRLHFVKDKSSCCSSTDKILRMRIRKKMEGYEYNSGLSAGIEKLNNSFSIVNEFKDTSKPELSGTSLFCTGDLFLVCNNTIVNIKEIFVFQT
ncbi:hypothetical protein MAR_013614, partial [Mya arenaria]